MWQTLTVILLAIATFIATEFIGIFNKLNLVLTIALSLGLAFLLFNFSKKKPFIIVQQNWVTVP